MFRKWLEDNFKYRRKWLFIFGRRNPSVLEVSGRWNISNQQYAALLACIDYLEANIGVYGLFVSGGSMEHVKLIFGKIKSGCPHLLQYLRSAHVPRECAIAFHQFLTVYRVQVLPRRCTNVVQGDVAGVPKRLIALDVLNLLHEEFDDTRLHFATRYLQLMRRFSLYGFLRPTEIRAIIAPYLALPKIFPEPDVRHTFAAKSMVLLELFLLANLLNDPQGLAEELQRACAEFRATPAGKQQP
uniref:Rho-GAP domain-containing protein n=1 Tax=Anopheles atroparvus TaxID=41427 RepID=A0A182JMV7_ANOAO